MVSLLAADFPVSVKQAFLQLTPVAKILETDIKLVWYMDYSTFLSFHNEHTSQMSSTTMTNKLNPNITT